jgi:hypothetical protein
MDKINTVSSFICFLFGGIWIIGEIIIFLSKLKEKKNGTTFISAQAAVRKRTAAITRLSARQANGRASNK